VVLPADVIDEGDEFGASVALSGDGSTGIIGGPGDIFGESVGAAWAFLHHPSTLEGPEVGRCRKVVAGFGSYGSNCTTLVGGSKHDWFPELVKTGFKTALAEGVVKLETVSLSKIVCTGAAGTGEFAGGNAVERVTLTLTGCERSAQKCTSSGAGEGEVLTPLLSGVLGTVTLGETPAKNTVGLDLSPTAPGPMLAFTCGTSNVSIRGSVILPFPTPKMALLYRLKAVALKGKQKIEHFVEGPTDVLESSVDEGAYERIGLSAIFNLTLEEKGEFNPAF
jgi:hypothetical protein